MSEVVTLARLKINQSQDPTGNKLLGKIKSIDPSEPDSGWWILRTTVVYSEGGWVRFDGSQERMYFGPECNFRVGDEVRVTFEHV